MPHAPWSKGAGYQPDTCRHRRACNVRRSPSQPRDAEDVCPLAPRLRNERCVAQRMVVVAVRLADPGRVAAEQMLLAFGRLIAGIPALAGSQIFQLHIERGWCGERNRALWCVRRRFHPWIRHCPLVTNLAHLRHCTQAGLRCGLRTRAGWLAVAFHMAVNPADNGVPGSACSQFPSNLAGRIPLLPKSFDLFRFLCCVGCRHVLSPGLKTTMFGCPTMPSRAAWSGRKAQ
jgi:hypothetical protein